jgi:hypothetical protein
LFGSQAAKLRKKRCSNANCNKLLCIARGWSTDAARVTKLLVKSFRKWG